VEHGVGLKLAGQPVEDGRLSWRHPSNRLQEGICVRRHSRQYTYEHVSTLTARTASLSTGWKDSEIIRVNDLAMRVEWATPAPRVHRQPGALHQHLPLQRMQLPISQLIWGLFVRVLSHQMHSITQRVFCSGVGSRALGVDLTSTAPC